MGFKEYLVLCFSEDGEVSASFWDKFSLLEKLNEHYWGRNVEFVESLSTENDSTEWSNKLLILKGEIIIPKAKNVITEFQI